MRLLFWVVLLSCLWTYQVHAFQFNIYGIQNQTSYEAGGVTSAGKSGSGFGVGFDVKNIEIDFTQIERIYTGAAGQTKLVYQQIPVFYQFGSGHVYAGLGGYYGRGQGDVQAPTGNFSYSAAGITTSDMGALALLGLQFNIKKAHLKIEGRYNYGIYNVSDVQDIAAKFNDTQIFLGIVFGGAAKGGK